MPEMWPGGLADWARAYEARLRPWLRAVEQAEEDGIGLAGVLLSVYMRESGDAGRFWLDHVARKSWAVDCVFWNFLDQPFFGAHDGAMPTPRPDLWKTRVHLLSERERDAMEPFEGRRMEESKERILVEWTEEQVKERMAQLLWEAE